MRRPNRPRHSMTNTAQSSRIEVGSGSGFGAAEPRHTVEWVCVFASHAAQATRAALPVLRANREALVQQVRWQSPNHTNAAPTLRRAKAPGRASACMFSEVKTAARARRGLL
jgi:hypothetical protein